MPVTLGEEFRQSVSVREGRTNLVEVLRSNASQQPARRAYTFLKDGEEEESRLTYGDLDRQVRAIGARLQALSAQGERALLLYPPGSAFLAAFLGCLYAGIVAVPTYLPRARRGHARLRAIAQDAEPRIALTSSSMLSRIESQLGELRDIRYLATDDVDPDGADAWREPDLASSTPAFFQYTSGSTAAPKGVIVTHANLVDNEEMIRRAFGQTEDSVVVSWLPPYHDMGLIGGLLQPLYVGGRCVLMSPMAFLRRPARWLEAISRYRATTSGGPNFAYDLCVQKVTAEERARLDLASWRLAFNGAEPVRAETLESFARLFGPCGFERRSFYPCYGLAEATLFVTGGSRQAEPVVDAALAAALERHRADPARPGEGPIRWLVGCGGPVLDERVVIADPESRSPCPPRQVGEIWVAGPSVAAGYWKRPRETARHFGASLAGQEQGDFLRTGDLGFVADDELFVTGRLKDLIIIRGRNHYPQDIEITAGRAHRVLTAGGGAAFSVDAENEERLVVVHELARQRCSQAGEAAEAVRRAVAEEHEARVYEVVLVRPGAVPRTSSGKVRRRACREAYLAGRLAVVFAGPLDSAQETEDAVTSSDVPTREALLTLSGEERRAALTAYLVGEAAAVARVDRSRVHPRRPLSALGLDSLAAVELQHRVESELEVTLPLAGLLAGTNLVELTAEVLALLDGAAAERSGAPRLVTGETGGDHPLSVGQKALWFLARLEPESTAYHLAAAVRVRQGLDTAALSRAFSTLLERHPSLRATIRDEAGEPRQSFGRHEALPWELEDATAWSRGEVDARLNEAACRPFDLERGPLCRLTTLACRNGEHRWVLSLHHLVADLWSLTVLLRELGGLYARQAGSGRGDAAPARPPASYADWVRWQSEMLAGPEGERLETYWRRRLAGVPKVLDLPADRPRPAKKSLRGARARRRLGSAATAAAHALARGEGTTLYTVLLVVFQELLRRYSGQPRFVVGSPTAGRRWAEVEDVVGYFVNPLPMVADLSGSPTGHELLARVRDGVAADLAHQDYPFALVVERLAPHRPGVQGEPLQAVFALQKSHWPEGEALAALALGWDGVEIDLGGLAAESIALAERGAPFELTLLAAEWDGRLGLALEYDRDVRDATTARRLLVHFENLLAALAAAPERPAAALGSASAAERAQLSHQWNDTASAYPREASLPALFATWVERTPDALAVVFDDASGTHLSYRALDAAARGLTERLRDLGVGPETPVGICLERSTAAIVATLGILQAGGAYVPLDPTYPAERLAFMLQDSGAPVLVTESRFEESLPDPLPAGVRAVRLDAPFLAAASAPQRAPRARQEVHSEQLAHVIYTSGSTGRPKGVAITQRGVARLVQETNYLVVRPGQRVSHASNISFDAATLEIWSALTNGACLVVIPFATTLDPRALAASLARHEVRVCFLTTALFSQVVRDDPAALASLDWMMFGGEAVEPQRVQEIVASGAAPERLLNLYGPAEDTTLATWHRITGDPGTSVPIGRPVAASRVWLLDSALRPVPLGASGEIVVGGDGLARGYLGRPALTAESFVPEALSRGTGLRLYRTGDKARQRGDGAVEFQGRFDDQVKIRGLRIELGEIEAAIRSRPEVRECLVVAREETRRELRLVAYVVGETAAPLELAAFLRRRLPEHMVPAAFVTLRALPLSPNGKVDRRALPAPEWSAAGADYAAPRSPVEELLAGIWAEVLDLDRVGIHDGFFELGGHSLIASRLLSRLRATFGVELPLRALFEQPTIAGLAARLDEVRGVSAVATPAVRPVPRRGELPLSFAQERLWFLDQLEPTNASYSIPLALRLTGALRPVVLAASLHAIVRRHEALRTTFGERDGRPFQILSEELDLPLPVVDLSALGGERRRAEWPRLAVVEARRAFDLARGPLVRVGLVRLGRTDHALTICCHHIVFDGGSVRILLDELVTSYEALSAGRVPRLAELPVQYADYAVWQRGQLRGDLREALLAYWHRQLSGMPEALELPTDRPRPRVHGYRGAALPLTLPVAVTGALKVLSRERGTTLFMTLLAVFQALLARLTGQDDVAVGSAFANRNRAELEGLIGFFVNTLVLRTDLRGDPAFPELQQRAREVVLGAYAHQDLPFEQLVEELAPQRDMSRQPLFQVMLVLTAAGPPPQLPGLAVRPLRVATGTAKFDLMLALDEDETGLAGVLEYDT